jgi:hypothetical protein
VAAELQLAVDALDLRRQAQVVEAHDLVPRGTLEHDVGERRSVPERERTCAERHGVLRRDRPGLLREALELEQVEGARTGLDLVPGRLGGERSRSEHAPQLVHVALDQVPRGGGRLLPPELVDELGDRDDAAGVEEQHAQERAGLGSAERQRALPLANLERSEDPELHAAPSVRTQRP